MGALLIACSSARCLVRSLCSSLVIPLQLWSHDRNVTLAPVCFFSPYCRTMPPPPNSAPNSKKVAIVRAGPPMAAGPNQGSLLLTSILALAYVAVQIYILNYIFQLEGIGCTCSRDFRRTYAQAYIIVSFLVPILQAALAAFATARTAGVLKVVQLGVSLLMMGAGVAYVVFVLQYIARLRRIKCTCSEAVARDVWETVTYIQAAVMVLVGIISLIVLVNLVAILGLSRAGGVMTKQLTK